MEKRKAGERSRILFNEIDCQIMNTIIKKQPMGVLELGELLGSMNHANLKKHLDKLEKSWIDKKESCPKITQTSHNLKRTDLYKGCCG